MGKSLEKYGRLKNTEKNHTLFLVPRGAEVETMPSAPVNHQVVPAPTMEQLEQLDLDPSTEGNTGEQVF